MRKFAGSLPVLALAAGAAFGAPVDAHILRTANAISLRSAALTLSSLDQLRSNYPSIADPGQKAAAAIVLAALAAAPAHLPARLATAAIPPAAAARLQKIAAALDAPNRAANAALIAQAEKILPANLLATFRAFMDGEKASAADPVAAEPVSGGAAGDELGRDWTKHDFKTLLSLRPRVSFGAESVPIVAMPTVGDAVSDLWVKLFGQSDSLRIAVYNFDDMNMARAIVAASKAGKKTIFVGDYSNFFPDREPQSGHGGRTAPRTAAMQHVIDNLNENLELWMLQGDGGKSAIQHNKFSLFSRGGKTLAQTGSFNYTGTSQKNHFENVVFTDDADRIAFLDSYHRWMVRRSRRYDPDLQPEKPSFPEDDPIPVDASRLAGAPLPKSVGTPRSQAESWLVQFLRRPAKEMLGAMFAMFPTPDEVAAIEERLAAGVRVTFLVDRGQISRAGALWGLVQKGLELYEIAGPEEGIYHVPPDPDHSKQHMKVITLDGGVLAKAGDSLNLSRNASDHNFENVGFHQGFVAAFLHAYIEEVMLPLATRPSAALLEKLKAAYDRERLESDKITP